ncbi:MAG: hypothetical protein HQ543_00250 [Bacteroidetes bacterium]|nr:hypothetical protein [Bacteroidota bacterium]
MINYLFVPSISDTLHVVNSSGRLSSIAIPLIVAISTLLGVIISIIGNYIFNNLLTKRKSEIEIRRYLFQQRLKIYQNMNAIIWNGSTTIINMKVKKPIAFPRAYTTSDDLKKWIEKTTQFFENNRLLIDKGTKDKFSLLSQKLLKDSQQVVDSKFNDEVCQRIGNESRDDIRNIVNDIYNVSCAYLNKKYELELEI